MILGSLDDHFFQHGVRHGNDVVRNLQGEQAGGRLEIHRHGSHNAGHRGIGHIQALQRLFEFHFVRNACREFGEILDRGVVRRIGVEAIIVVTGQGQDVVTVALLHQIGLLRRGNRSETGRIIRTHQDILRSVPRASRPNPDNVVFGPLTSGLRGREINIQGVVLQPMVVLLSLAARDQSQCGNSQNQM